MIGLVVALINTLLLLPVRALVLGVVLLVGQIKKNFVQIWVQQKCFQFWPQKCLNFNFGSRANKNFATSPSKKPLKIDQISDNIYWLGQ